MKKIIGAIIVITLTILFCTGCEVSNTELANSLDANMTRLVYSVGYLDSVSTAEFGELATNSSYFSNTQSNMSGADNLRNTNYRSSTFNNGLIEEETCCDEVVSNGDAEGNSLGGLYCENCGYEQNLANYQNTASVASNQNATNGLIEDTATDASLTFVSTDLIATSNEDLNQILLNISQKRGIIMLYCTDLRSGKSALTADDKLAINEYIAIIKETTNYLNNNATLLTTHMNNIKNVAYTENSQELINAKLIRVNEVLKTRYAKLDTCVDSLDAIIYILQKTTGIDYSSSYINNQSNVSLNSQTNDATVVETTPIVENATNAENNSTAIINDTALDVTNNTTNSNVNSENYGIMTLPYHPEEPDCCTQNNNTVSISNTCPPNCTATQNSNINNQTPTYSNNINSAQTNNCCNSINEVATNTNNPCNSTAQANNASQTNNIANTTQTQQNNANTQVYNNASNNPNLATTENVRLLENNTNLVTEETSPLTGIPEQSTSVNTPMPGTLISAVNIKQNNPIKTEDNNLEQGLKLVDKKEIKNNKINTNRTKTNTTKNVTDEKTTPQNTTRENVVDTKNNSLETKNTLPVKELGFITPLVQDNDTIKLLPYAPKN